MSDNDWITLWIVLAIFSPIPLYGLYLAFFD